MSTSSGGLPCGYWLQVPEHNEQPSKSPGLLSLKIQLPIGSLQAALVTWTLCQGRLGALFLKISTVKVKVEPFPSWTPFNFSVPPNLKLLPLNEPLLAVSFQTLYPDVSRNLELWLFLVFKIPLFPSTSVSIRTPFLKMVSWYGSLRYGYWKLVSSDAGLVRDAQTALAEKHWLLTWTHKLTKNREAWHLCLILYLSLL
jgi:hypothetical protein